MRDPGLDPRHLPPRPRRGSMSETNHALEETKVQPMTLGRLIDALEQRPREQIVHFDFGYLAPTCFASYRGFYDHLALGYEEPREYPTVAQVLAEARACVGKVFTGWKGGDYRMDLDTPVWVANPGGCPNSCLVGVDGDEHETVLQTGWCSAWYGPMTWRSGTEARTLEGEK
jgi:hypothetical protein